MQNFHLNQEMSDKAQEFQSRLDKFSGKTFYFEYSSEYGLNLYPKNPDNVPVGGRGVTRRNWQQLESNFDQTLNERISVADSIIFFGNGLSLVPLDIKQRFPEKRVSIVDMVDFSELANFYLNNSDLINSVIKSYPEYASDLLSFFKNALELVEAEKRGEIRIFHHSLGASHIDMGMYDLGINCYGPPIDTLDEQLMSIAPNGSILFKPDRSPFQVINKSR